ncbi:hypothetical protein [Phytobacter diazotrophicus]|uniref:hypothetical protein n=1 Tax=Phytobacter diazotrophicus TaxID=395631 RepID=UPI002FF4752B
MKAVTKPCPICGADALSYAYINELVNFKAKPIVTRSVPSVTYVCEEHGWFSLSEAVNNMLASSTDPSLKEKLSAKVKERYFPEDLVPLALKPIESLD